jgi:hypothetical protein
MPLTKQALRQWGNHPAVKATCPQLFGFDFDLMFETSGKHSQQMRSSGPTSCQGRTSCTQGPTVAELRACQNSQVVRDH